MYECITEFGGDGGAVSKKVAIIKTLQIWVYYLSFPKNNQIQSQLALRNKKNSKKSLGRVEQKKRTNDKVTCIWGQCMPFRHVT